MQKLWKALVTIGILALLFWPPCERFLPQIVSVILFIATLTYGVSLFLSTKLPAPRRIGTSYLVFVGFTYLWAGIWGIYPHGDLIEAGTWSHLISPYLLVSFFDQMSRHYPYPASKTAFHFLPEGKHYLYSTAVLVVSVIAIVAAFGMAKSYRIASQVWLVLLCLSIVAFAGYVIVGILSWGFQPLVTPVCWEISYILAFVLARKEGVPFKPGFCSVP